MKHAIPDIATARRCIDALAEYLAAKDDSPRAAADLRESVRLLSSKPLWQPIETCPRDGFFLVYEDGAVRTMFREGGEWKATALALDNIHGEPDHAIKVRETGVYNPTHWMALPDGPE